MTLTRLDGRLLNPGLFLSRADAEAGRTDPTTNSIVVYAAGEECVYKRDASGNALTMADGSTWSPAGAYFSSVHFDVDLTGATDCTAEMQKCMDWASGGRICILAPGKYRFHSSVTLKSNTTIRGRRSTLAGANGVIFLQYGANLLVGEEDLESVEISGVSFDLQYGSANAYTVALALKAHRKCKFDDLEFIRYDDATICERMPTTSASVNTIDNAYTNWHISACRHISIDIGLEGYYYKTAGDGTTGPYTTTGQAWPETNPGSIVVLKESFNRIFTQLELTTDYTLSYNGSDEAVITTVANLTASERIHVWPAQPRTDGNRRPISNNLWENIRCQYCFARGHTAVRWVDAETHRFERILLAADQTRAYITNPYTNRTGQGGDYNTYQECVISYWTSLGLTLSTLYGWDFGPGSVCMVGESIRMDAPWKVGSTNRSVFITDGRRVALTGTVAGTSGSPTLTGTSTVFTEEVTLIGTNKDRIEVDGNIYAITSIDSDTQITLASNLSTSPSGATAYRVNTENQSEYQFEFASMGDGFTYSKSGQGGRATYNSLTERYGSAVIASGNTSVTVTHGLPRAPKVGEIMVVPHTVTNGRTWSLSGISTTSFTINVNTAAAADYTFGWQARLFELN